MAQEPIQLHFIVPGRASTASRHKIQCLRKLAEHNATIHLRLSVYGRKNGAFEAVLQFDETDQTGSSNTIPQSAQPKALATEQEIREHAQTLAQNPLFLSLEPSKKLLVLMRELNKLVYLKSLVSVCKEVLGMNSDTVRGSLNKNSHHPNPLYHSPERGVWGVCL